MKDLDPVALDSLAALADHGSFDRAAAAQSITQSAMSQRVRALETALGQRVVVRSRPLRLTPAGQVLLRYARQLRLLRADALREVTGNAGDDLVVPIAVNADSLATWILPALDEVVRQGHPGGYGVEIVVDDQDHTHEGLRQGAVLGCVSTVGTALRGCRVTPLGVMHYVAAASPWFHATRLSGGLTRANFAATPFVVFNRKDELQSRWVETLFGVRGVRLRERFVPSAEAFVQAIERGWGVGMVPDRLAEPAFREGRLVALHPEVRLPVALYWHQWRLDGGEVDAAPGTLLDRIGKALQAHARVALDPIDPDA